MSLYDPDYRKLLDSLRVARVSAGLSQEQVGERIGRHQTFVSKMEKAQRYLDIPDFVRWALVVNVDPASLIARLRDDLLARDHRHAQQARRPQKSSKTPRRVFREDE